MPKDLSCPLTLSKVRRSISPCSLFIRLCEVWTPSLAAHSCLPTMQ
jgi:hypothetical protein